MADHTFDSRLEVLLREALAAEVESLPFTVSPDHVLDRAASRKSGREIGWRAFLGRLSMPRFLPALRGAIIVVLVAALALSFYVNKQGDFGVVPSPSATTNVTPPAPSVDLGIFEAVEGRIVYGDQYGIWAVDPASSDRKTRVQLTAGGGTPLGWSSDGTRLLIMGEDNLFVLDADGSETSVVGRPTPTGLATLSPHGSRVVFAADGALYAVDADGGPTAILLSQSNDVGFEELAFSPDGTQIAYAEGAGDHGHSVWVMNADGTNAHRIVPDEISGTGHVHGLAWSPAGDRIALGFEGFIYTFATDGSDFRQIAGADASCSSAESCAVQIPSGATSPYWSPDGSQIAYTTRCADGVSAAPAGCLLAIADADGSNVRQLSYGLSGPWHPGTPSPSPSPSATASPSSSQLPTSALGIFEPVAGRIVYGTGSFVAVDPSAPPPVAGWRRVELIESGTPLVWSGDGTRLLFMRASGGQETLFVLHADGSETQVTTDPMTRIRGATISSDGSRVVFAGSIETAGGECCEPWALYGVDTDGGSAEMLIESRIGILDDVSFSPDGTRIAYVDGAGDNNHHVWVMNADGSDAHEVASKDCGCHVYGLAWSPAADQIAIGIEGTTYTFAPDGSDFAQVIARGDQPYWSPDGSQIAYRMICADSPYGCGLAIAEADGSNVRSFTGPFGVTSGPWHPGTLVSDAGD